MIYPRCYNGTITPMVGGDGILYPCCQATESFTKELPKVGTPKVKIKNPFADPDFSLYNKSFEEIVESKKWNRFITELRHTELKICTNICGSRSGVRNSFKIDAADVWKDKRVLTKDIDTIQLETSSRCTLECLYCSRQMSKITEPKESKDWLNKFDLDLRIIEDVLLYKPWNSILDCGTFSDPIFYKYYHEMLEVLDMSMVKNYIGNIAATGRTEAWWDQTHEMWKYLNDTGIYISIFWGVDGLSDTSKLHRVNQDWDEITTQMKRLAKNGINSTWQYIPMSFNEHQIKEAKQMAEDWGVHFFLKPSDRFKENDPNKPSDDLYYKIQDIDNVKVHVNEPKKEMILKDE